MENGKLVISLDFELLWGVFDKVHLSEKRTYFQNTRAVIPGILNLFTQYQVSCTWATVGMLFNENWAQWESNIPRELPNYKNAKLSPYLFGRDVKGSGTEAMCFAPGLVQLINDTPGQELATHTYSHYYCSEEGQTVAAFKADLEKAIYMAEQLGVQLNSLVFPRNQLNNEYLEICYERGIQTVRSNPDNWYWKETQESSLSKRLFRTGDAYLGIKDKSYAPSEVVRKQGKPSQQKASRLLRSFSPNTLMNQLKLHRITSEMSAAARRGEVYHLWWHPHNFGDHPEENLTDLKVLLDHYQFLKEKYGFESVHMAGLDLQTKSEKEF